VIVVDGGSGDETAQIVRRHGLRLIGSERGRGAQMHAGACASRGEVLWFLHADTQPAPESARHISEALRDPHVVGGNFNVSFDSARFAVRFLTWLYRQLRRLVMVTPRSLSGAKLTIERVALSRFPFLKIWIWCDVFGRTGDWSSCQRA